VDAPLLHVSQLLKAPLLDRAGERLGRVEDVIVRLDDDYPPVTGVRALVANRDVFVPAERIAELAPGRVALSGHELNLGRFERREGEVLLGKDVLDHQLINVEGARLVRTNDVELARIEGWWRVVGVDTGPRGALRRLLPRPLGARVGAGPFLDWASVEPFVGHVPTVRLRVPHPKLAKLHPAQLADLVEAASHRQGEEIMQAVHDDRELEADVFEELDERHQLEFLEERPDDQVAAVVARMGADDAADVVAELDEGRREKVLALLPTRQRIKVRALLGYDPATAGGLMTPDFLVLYRQAGVDEALERVRASELPPEVLAMVYVMDSHRALTGAVPLSSLVRADPEDDLVDIADPTPRLVADADFEEVARLMADFNLVCAPVVDDQERLIGVVTVDDGLEVLLPWAWRRRFGLLGEE
jgi:CBS domain-containing protein